MDRPGSDHAIDTSWQSLCAACGATIQDEVDACPECGGEVVPVDKLLRNASVKAKPERTTRSNPTFEEGALLLAAIWLILAGMTLTILGAHILPPRFGWMSLLGVAAVSVHFFLISIGLLRLRLRLDREDRMRRHGRE